MQIYLTVNSVNKKWYIGRDKNSSTNYFGSGTFLKKAIKKYGILAELTTLKKCMLLTFQNGAKNTMLTNQCQLH